MKKNISGFAAWLMAASAAVACAPESEVGSTELGAQDAAVSGTKKGLKLRGIDDNTALKIDLGMEFGTDTGTGGLHTHLTRAFVSRKGSKAFNAYCSISAELRTDGSTTTASCKKYTDAVDFDQMLTFDVVLFDGFYGVNNVELHGDELKDEFDALSGGGIAANEPMEIPLEKKKSVHSLTSNPFEAPYVIFNALSPLFGKRAYSEDAGKESPMVGFRFDVNEYFDATVLVQLEGQKVLTELTDRLSMLEEPRKFDSGFVSAEELAERAEDAVPRLVACDNGGPAGTIEDPVPAIENSFTPLSGPDSERAFEVVDLDLLPEAVREALQDAATEIEARSFDGTDYEAQVEGYYGVWASCAGAPVVAYVVWGVGAGEPDYHDGIVIGIDLNGNRVYEYEDNG